MTISVENLRTVEDLRREREQPVGGEDLDRNAFLRLFTTQLQNQNPLDPLKNEAFVAQLAQFSTLEATYAMSDSLGDFLATQQSERMLRGANLLGRNVYAPDVTMVQTGGQELDGIVTVAGFGHGMPLGLESLSKDEPDGILVVGDENGHRG